MAKELAKQYVQCRVSFSGPVSAREGQIFDADDPIVKRWPEYFGPLTVAHSDLWTNDVEQATAAPGEKRGA